jgi:hypothetical protein
MTKALRHSHIALRRSLDGMAKLAGLDIISGTDDLSPYRFFDLHIQGADNTSHGFRLAERDGDPLVHILAENSGDIATLSKVLVLFGITQEAELSISTDQNGHYLLNPADIVVAVQNAKNEIESAYNLAKFTQNQMGKMPLSPSESNTQRKMMTP